jgi:hypothetical protein
MSVCKACNGNGFISQKMNCGELYYRDCPDCAGTGKAADGLSEAEKEIIEFNWFQGEAGERGITQVSWSDIDRMFIDLFTKRISAERERILKTFPRAIYPIKAIQIDKCKGFDEALALCVKAVKGGAV